MYHPLLPMYFRLCHQPVLHNVLNMRIAGVVGLCGVRRRRSSRKVTVLRPLNKKMEKKSGRTLTPFAAKRREFEIVVQRD